MGNIPNIGESYTNRADGCAKHIERKLRSHGNTRNDLKEYLTKDGWVHDIEVANNVYRHPQAHAEFGGDETLTAAHKAFETTDIIGKLDDYLTRNNDTLSENSLALLATHFAYSIIGAIDRVDNRRYGALFNGAPNNDNNQHTGKPGKGFFSRIFGF